MAVIKEATQAIEKALRPKASMLIDDNMGIFEGDGPPVLQVGLKAHEDQSIDVELALSKDSGEQVGTFAKTAEIVDGEGVCSFKLDLEPGFYHAVFSMACDEGKIELTSSNIGINPELISSPQDKQPDFDAFWEQTLAELAAVEPEYTLTLLEEHSNDVRRTYRV